MKDQKVSAAATPDFAIFILGLEQRYQVSLEEILNAAAKFGYNKGKIRGYFEVRSFLKNKQQPVESLNASMVNRWFPAV